MSRHEPHSRFARHRLLPHAGAAHARAGRYSAEEFFETTLAPNYKEAVGRDAQLLLDLDGTAGVAASFLDEVCSRLVESFGAADVAERLLVVSLEEPYLEEEIHDRVASRARGAAKIGAAS